MSYIITIFGIISILSALMVITEKNTIHAVFYLVMSFVNTAIILIIYGVDYLGLLIIIVYVGAIAILFLFVVMMINIKSEDTNRTRYTPIGLIITTVLILEVYMVYPKLILTTNFGVWETTLTTNIVAIGQYIYNWPIIMYASLVLLVAMIGAIVLTLSHSEGVKRQDLFSKWTQ